MPQTDLHLRDLRFFEAIAESGHMGQAAEKIGRSQPALSKCVRRLEEAVGSPLFERDGRGIRLTAVGEVLRQRAQVLRGAADYALREVSDFAHGRAGHVRIGSGPIAADFLLPELCRLVLRDGARTTVSIVIGPSWELHEDLRNGKIDMLIGLTTEGETEFRSVPIVEDVVVVAARRNHPIFRQRRITMESLLQYAWALPSPNIPSRQWLDLTFASNGYARPNVQIEAGSIPLLPRMIARTDLLSFVSRHTLALHRGRELKEVAFAPTTLRRKLGVTSRRGGVLSPAAQHVMTLLESDGAALFRQALRGAGSA
ncbi:MULTISPECIES: LysR family transcriptional regulator [Ramlibacter]|uniref:LysR family transcriptional regulator n=1 Tax=Ramlibacter pinisoli TaxID=2682844 RepID=A0A6N8IZ39_9BURK|nr:MULTISPECIES: LysR family transcriptional regulator [Ramlibacter]MBA2962359.1 LysR family transcriptional regulator [Ramlibacter sp. CGMCC 1.13660]MVQ32301.1 LysR family transcriptional regulator [Ramlibacter pinisoli]